jgi:5-methylcytosine-specific restriction protein A
VSRLRTLVARIPMLAQRRVATLTTASYRMTGRALQARRLRIWVKSPYCAACGRLVAMHEFELDHTVALTNGGADTDANCQVLCNAPDGGCHRAKTARDLRRQ